MLKRLFGAAVLMSLLAVPAAGAEPLFCSGTIDRILINANGSVLVFPSWRGEWIQICSLETAVNGVSPKVCSVWVSEAMAAHTTRRATIMRYDNVPYTTCAPIPSYYDAPPLSYLLLDK